MFEEEIKLQRESSYIPLALVVVLIAVIVGTIGYFVVPSKSLSQEQAAGLVSAYLAGQGPATVHFHVGVLQPSVDEKIRDPHYRLLEKAGILKLGKSKGEKISVAFAPEGERRLAAIPGVVKTKNSDGTDAYTVPSGGTPVGGRVQGDDERPRRRRRAVHLEMDAQRAGQRLRRRWAAGEELQYLGSLHAHPEIRRSLLPRGTCAGGLDLCTRKQGLETGGGVERFLPYGLAFALTIAGSAQKQVGARLSNSAAGGRQLWYRRTNGQLGSERLF